MNIFRVWIEDISDIIFLLSFGLIFFAFVAYKLEKIWIKRKDLRVDYGSGTCELCLGVLDLDHMALVHPTKTPLYYRFILVFSMIMVFGFLLSIDCTRPEYDGKKYDSDMQGYDSARTTIN